MKKDKWEEKFRLLVKYLEENNGEYPKSNEMYKGVNLGAWINIQRSVYKNGIRQENGLIRYNSYTTTDECIQKLNEINFQWNSKKSVLWIDKYNLLIKYLKEHNGKYPDQNEYYENVALGTWINTQRTIYNNGKKQEDGSIRYNSSILTEERIDKLNAIDFIWSIYTEDFFSNAWMKNYRIL